MKRACPYCHANSISTLKVLWSAVGIGPDPACSACHGKITVGSDWQGNYAGALLLGFVLTAGLCAHLRNHFPYTFFILAASFGSVLVGRQAKIRQAAPKVPMTRWLSMLHFAALTFAVAALVYTLV